jgi:hypothetical protein
VVYRRSCLERYGYWPENVPSAADWRHWIAIIEGGGRRSLAYLPIPTCLHFSADWKKSRHSAVEEVRIWLEVADSVDWWPPVLRWRIPPGIPEQKIISEAMQAGGVKWVDEVRAAVETVIDRLAWDDIRVVRPRAAALQTELGEVRRQLDAAEREREALRHSLSQTLASTSWRITAPMRVLKQLLRGQD